jgi:ribosomal-protein-alanine N-acetyltransferase
MNMGKQPTLQTERLVLRPFNLTDSERVSQLAGAREIAQNTSSMPHPYEKSMAEEWIGTHEELYSKGESVQFAICLKSSNELIGAIGLIINRTHDRGEMGYWIGLPYWSKGFCTEAAGAMLKYGFEGLNLNRIGAAHFSRNPASGRVMRKLGMQFEGIRRQEIKRWGEYIDVVSYGILRQDYMPLES